MRTAPTARPPPTTASEGGSVNSTRRAWLVKTSQYLLGALALAWVLGRAEWGRVVALLGDVSLGTAVALVAVSALGLLTALWMWHVLLDSVQDTTFRAAADTGLVVLFVNHLLPSRLSGRAVAPFVVHSRTGMPYSGAIAVSGVHTGLYALLYGLVAAVGLALGAGRLSVGLSFVLVVSTALYAAAGTLVLLAGVHLGAVERIAGGMEVLAHRVPVVGDRLSVLAGKLPAFSAASANIFHGLLSDPGAMVSYTAGFVISLLVVPGLRVWLIFESLGVGFEPALLLPVYLVMAYSVTLLPLTPGGIGVTEASATAVFVALGVPEAVVVPAIFADRVLSAYLPALVGWYPSLKLDLSGLTESPSHD
jgi:uncharacterized protein (TIRG00374 family)